MQSKGTRFFGLALTLLGALAGLALVAAPAQAGCEICDQYTLDIPEPNNDGGDSSGGDSSESAPAPAPAPVAPVTPAPVTPVEPTTAVPGTEPDRDKPKPEPEPEPDYVSAKALAGAVGDAYAAAEDNVPAQSTPLSYDEGDSTSDAALAGLGSPETAALLVILLAAGAAVAIGRRRSA